MGAHSLQGVALLVFLVAFTFLSLACFYGGSVLFLVAFVVTFVASAGLFRKAKAIDEGVAH